MENYADFFFQTTSNFWLPYIENDIRCHTTLVLEITTIGCLLLASNVTSCTVTHLGILVRGRGGGGEWIFILRVTIQEKNHHQLVCGVQRKPYFKIVPPGPTKHTLLTFVEHMQVRWCLAIYSFDNPQGSKPCDAIDLTQTVTWQLILIDSCYDFVQVFYIGTCQIVNINPFCCNLLMMWIFHGFHCFFFLFFS